MRASQKGEYTLFVVTNREVDNRRQGANKLGKKLNPKGPNELRIAEAVKRNGSWEIAVLPDTISPAMKREVGIETRETVYASEYLARRLLACVNPPRAREHGIKGARGKGRDLLLFVHGFNNDAQAILERAGKLERLYGVEVVAFSWPADGGGLPGVVSYKSDKRDAKASIGALDRTLEAMGRLLGAFNDDYVASVKAEAARKFPDDPERQVHSVDRLCARACPFTINALFHSMGNYLYKHLLFSTSSQGTGLLFDNVILASADTNNENHAAWVDRINCRNRVFITINEGDFALRTARVKGGEEQKARLGHYPHRLNSHQAVYIQVSDAGHVGSSHAYFEGRPVSNRGQLWKFFNAAFRGEKAEKNLQYELATNMYHVE